MELWSKHIKTNMNVLSLFDGISCGQVALNVANIEYNKYFASEIDKHAIKVTQHNFPHTIQLGDINLWENWNLPNIDLLLGGSPCQNLSSIGNKQNLNGPKSSLFYKFIEVFNHYKPTYFLFENVASMNNESKTIISNLLGVDPIFINSNIFVPQNRKRLYWTNIPVLPLPAQTNVIVQDILEKNVDAHYFLTSYQLQQAFKITSFNAKPEIDLNIARPLVTIAFSQRAAKDNLYTFNTEIHPNKSNVRKLTPTEFEKLQGLPYNYTSIISETQRYKSIGNGWTINVIQHILNGLHS